MPYSIMNLFGVLKYKKMGEDFVRNSGIPFTIIRYVTPNFFSFFSHLLHFDNSVIPFRIMVKAK